MSILTDFYTFEVMDGATVHSVSSELTDHPAEHAISPLEPNFAWQADETTAQHTFVTDLGEPRSCDGFTFIHQEAEFSVPVNEGLLVTMDKSEDGVNWVSVPLAFNSDGTNVPNDQYDGTRIKLRHFTDGVETLESQEARYWRVTFKGSTAPFFYAPSDMRINSIWLFRISQLDRGAGYPVDDTPIYPSGDVGLAYGKVYRTGYNVNPHTIFNRTWMVNENEYSVLLRVMRECNGVHRPFILYESTEGVRRLCNFLIDDISEELLDVGLYRATARFVEIPLVRKDKYH